MDWIQELAQAKSLQYILSTFIEQYGLSGLEEAMRLYSNMQKEYLCKTKVALTKIKIADIYYLEVRKHTITIYTCDTKSLNLTVWM